jgi:hypothetical protein
MEIFINLKQIVNNIIVDVNGVPNGLNVVEDMLKRAPSMVHHKSNITKAISMEFDEFHNQVFLNSFVEKAPIEKVYPFILIYRPSFLKGLVRYCHSLSYVY